MSSPYPRKTSLTILILILPAAVLFADVEVVLGSRSVDDRLLVPYVYDFNESTLYDEWTPRTADIVARAMHYKNGKNYFPHGANPYTEDFNRGFVSGCHRPDGPEHVKRAYEILQAYKSL